MQDQETKAELKSCAWKHMKINFCQHAYHIKHHILLHKKIKKF